MLCQLLACICSVTPTLCRRDVCILLYFSPARPSGCTTAPRDLPPQHLSILLIAHPRKLLPLGATAGQARHETMLAILVWVR